MANQQKRPINRKYLFICEGQCTEPDYIKGIIRNKFNLKINEVISLKEIPKLKMDANETDIQTLIEIAKDYVDFCITGIFSRRMIVTLTFESASSSLNTSYEYNLIKDENKELRELRHKIDQELDSKGIPEHSLSEKDVNRVCEICRDVFTSTFNSRMDDHLKPYTLKREPIFDTDQICIVHDRDYNDKYFPDSKYMDACEMVDKLNKDLPRFRLIITYPKFEFWLLMHSIMLNVKTLDKRKLNDYTNQTTSRYVDSLVETFLDIWKKGSKKRIDDEKFDMSLSPYIDLAIHNIEYNGFSTDVRTLCHKPGSSMATIMKELIGGQ